MSRRNSSSASEAPQFTFVTENSKPEARSHAMREHWKQRRRRKQESKSSHRQSSQTLFPRAELNDDDDDDDPGRFQDNVLGLSVPWEQDDSDDNGGKDPNITTQILRGVNRALSTSMTDPFQTCPIRLTSQHQKLLHHCTFKPIINE
jgi:hypothetical protein